MQVAKPRTNYEPILADLKEGLRIAIEREDKELQRIILLDMATMYLHHYRYKYLKPS